MIDETVKAETQLRPRPEVRSVRAAPLIDLRDRLGLTQVEMAERLGMTSRGYQDVEAGKSALTDRMMKAANFIMAEIAAERDELTLAPPVMQVLAKRIQEGGARLANQLVGNAGLYYVARELTRRGWHVMPTVRNARGADLFAVNADESRVLPVQSKAVTKKRDTILLGTDLEALRSPWWALTVNATGDKPTSFILTLEEVKAGARRAVTGGHYLLPSYYMADEFNEAWARLGNPGDPVEPA